MKLLKKFFFGFVTGAYESDAAIFLRSRPIINVVTDFMITPQNISLEKGHCKDSRGKDVPCVVQITFCLGYNGDKHISERLSFVYNVTLDGDHYNHPRLTIRDYEISPKRLDLEKNKGLRCHAYTAIIHVSIECL